jgi:hypothetical protein
MVVDVDRQIETKFTAEIRHQIDNLLDLNQQNALINIAGLVIKHSRKSMRATILL